MRALWRALGWRDLVPPGVLGVAAALAVAGGVAAHGRIADSACRRCHATVAPQRYGPTSQPGHAGLACVECHAPHGDWLGSPPSAAPANVSEACRRCHPGSATATELATDRAGPRGLRFSHAVHVEEQSLSCTRCHATLFHSDHETSAPRPSKATCLSGGCHVDAASRSACAVCHEPSAVAAPDSAEPAGASVCLPCHWTFASAPPPPEGRGADHNLHAGAGVPCERCHPADGGHGEVVPAEQCAACHHEPQLGPACEDCHRTERDWRRGQTGSAEVAGAEEAMWGLADCVDCHPDVAKGKLPATREAAVSGCAECHAEDDPPRDLAGLVAGWRHAHEQAVALAGLSLRIPEPPPRQNKPDVVRWVLGRDASRGVHNPGLTQSLLREARRRAGLPLEAPASTQGPPLKEERR